MITKAKKGVLKEALKIAKIKAALSHPNDEEIARILLEQIELLGHSLIGDYSDSSNPFMGNESITIALVGQFSAGKSTLLNHILRLDNDFLPVGLNETTAIPTLLLPGNDISEVFIKIGKVDWLKLDNMLKKEFQKKSCFYGT